MVSIPTRKVACNKVINVTCRRLSNGTIEVTVKREGIEVRNTTLIIGKEYISEPLNRNKKRNRGRQFIIRKFNEQYVQVKYTDNNKAGRMPYDDIKNIEATGGEEQGSGRAKQQHSEASMCMSDEQS